MCRLARHHETTQGPDEGGSDKTTRANPSLLLFVGTFSSNAPRYTADPFSPRCEISPCGFGFYFGTLSRSSNYYVLSGMHHTTAYSMFSTCSVGSSGARSAAHRHLLPPFRAASLHVNRLCAHLTYPYIDSYYNVVTPTPFTPSLHAPCAQPTPPISSLSWNLLLPLYLPRYLSTTGFSCRSVIQQLPSRSSSPPTVGTAPRSFVRCLARDAQLRPFSLPCFRDQYEVSTCRSNPGRRHYA